MCQTATISRSIGRLGRRSYDRRMRVLIGTLKDLYKDSLMRAELKESNERLREHIDDLVELDHDIVNFRVRLQEDEEAKQTMKAIGGLVTRSVGLGSSGIWHQRTRISGWPTMRR